MKIGDRVKFLTASGKSYTYGELIAIKPYPIVELDNGVRVGCNIKDLKVVKRWGVKEL